MQAHVGPSKCLNDKTQRAKKLMIQTDQWDMNT